MNKPTQFLLVLGTLLINFSPPMASGEEVSAPPEGLKQKWDFYNFEKYLHIDEYDVHVLGTAGVSEWMMQESTSLVTNIIRCLKAEEYRKKYAGHQAYLITDADPDLSRIGSVKGHRNTGGDGFSMFNEALVCKEAVDTIRPDADPVYRAWDTPVHEFGHSVEHTLKLEARSDALYSANVKNYNAKVAREYFAWSTERWFKADGRESMPKWEFDYLASIFSAEDPWLPSREPRDK